MRWFHLRDPGGFAGETKDVKIHDYTYTDTDFNAKTSLRNNGNDINQDVLMIYHDLSMIAKW